MKKTQWIALFLSIGCLLSLAACDANRGKGEQTQAEDPYSFVIEGSTITPGKGIGSLFVTLNGEAPQISVKASCLGGVDGEDVTYSYKGFRVQTFRTGEGDAEEEIRWVILTDDSVQTVKGIAIGDTAEKVSATYGEPSRTTDSLLIYQRGGTLLRFKIRDGVVTNIDYTVAE